MNMMKLAAAAAFFCIASTAVSAADYQYLNGKIDSHWRADLLAWLAKNKPDPSNVSIGITPDGDVHAYAVLGQFTGIYSIQRLHHPADRANTAFRSIMDGGTGRIIGFGLRKHPTEPVANRPSQPPPAASRRSRHPTRPRRPPRAKVSRGRRKARRLPSTTSTS